MKPYEIIEHTADIAIKVRGSDLKELFRNAALSVFDIIAEKKDQKSGKKIRIHIKQKAGDLEELFVNWLNEVISLSAAKGLIFSEFIIDAISKDSLDATAIGEGAVNYRVNKEFKAATYHELKIGEDVSGWQAEVIFDV